MSDSQKFTADEGADLAAAKGCYSSCLSAALVAFVIFILGMCWLFGRVEMCLQIGENGGFQTNYIANECQIYYEDGSYGPIWNDIQSHPQE